LDFTGTWASNLK